MITFIANAREAKYTSDDVITSGSVGIPVTVSLSEDFNGLSCIVVFQGSGQTLDVALVGTECVVPHEVLTVPGGYLRIGVYARDAAGTIVIPTVWAASSMILQGAAPSGVDPSEPTPDWTAQVQQQAATALENSEQATTVANQAQQQAATALENSEQAIATANQAKDAATEAQDSAATASASAQSAAGSATEAAGSAMAAAEMASSAAQRADAGAASAGDGANYAAQSAAAAAESATAAASSATASGQSAAEAAGSARTAASKANEAANSAATALKRGLPEITAEDEGKVLTVENGVAAWREDKGGGGSAASKAVNFRDYDGTIVASYTADEFASLTAMPANPDHTSDNLTAQGWNWSLANAKAYVAKYGALEVGQMYITTDGKTHIQIHLEKGRTSPVLGVGVNGTVDVDWGDGTAHDTLTGTNVGTTQWTQNHAYAAPGDYDIALTVTGQIRISGDSSAEQYTRLLRYSSVAQADYRNDVYQAAIQSIRIGENVELWENAFLRCNVLSSITIPNSVTIIRGSAFRICRSLSSITIPDSVTSIGVSAFSNCSALSGITIPDSVTSIGISVFQNCSALSSITIPDSVTSIRNSAFAACATLRSITIPDGVTSIEDSVFQNCYVLSSITIPDGVTSIRNSVFQNCSALSSITIPDSVTSIRNSAFAACRSMAEYHVLPTTPPTLGITVFDSIPADCIIYVPYSADHSILEAYKAATNWSAYASYMQEEPQS